MSKRQIKPLLPVTDDMTLRQAVEDLQETIALLPDTTFIQPGVAICHSCGSDSSNSDAIRLSNQFN